MKTRRAGLQRRWAHVVNSLQVIIPSYERASSRISLFADKKMRAEAVGFAAKNGSLVLDLGAGPGTMSRLVEGAGGEPVLLDVSMAMLRASSFPNRVRGAFENLPFRPAVFDAVVSGFAVRDALDLEKALNEVTRTLKKGGRFAFCDLGKPDSALGCVMTAAYLRVVPPVIGLMSNGRTGFGYGTLFDTYLLFLHNSELGAALSNFFSRVTVHEMMMGGAIVVKCSNEA